MSRGDEEKKSLLRGRAGCLGVTSGGGCLLSMVDSPGLQLEESGIMRECVKRVSAVF